MEASMNIKALAQELADMPFDTDYTFENGKRFCEALNAERAEALLNALLERGYVVSYRKVESPSIHESGRDEREPAHH
jgi:hypothetical protein